MEVIALRGAPNQGKSETINIVYQYILLFGYKQVPGHFEVLNKDLKDFIDVVEKDGVKIGIVSMGDYEKTDNEYSISRLLEILFNAGCQRAICGCTINPRQPTEEAVKKYSHIFINKTQASDDGNQRIVNGKDAETLYKLATLDLNLDVLFKKPH
ncbi:MAG: hypothetical protein V4592_12355 [Bacteroidota bacterium]